MASAGDDSPALTLTPTATKSSPGTPVEIVLTSRRIPDGSIVELHNPHQGQLWLPRDNCGDGSRGAQKFALRGTHALLCLNSVAVQDVSAVATTQLSTGSPVVGASSAVTFTEARWWETATFTTVLGALLGIGSTLITTQLSQGREERRKAAADKRAFRAEQQSFLLGQLFPELSGHGAIIAANLKLASANPQQLAFLPMKSINDAGTAQRRSILESYLRDFNQADFLKCIEAYARFVATYNQEAELLSRSKGSVTQLQASGDAIVSELRRLGLY